MARKTQSSLTLARWGMLAAVLASPTAVRADISPVVFVVNTTEDGNDGGCDVFDCTLREAVFEASGILDKDVLILLSHGVYTLSIPGTDSGGLLGDLDINFGQVTISGVSPAATVIDANFIDRVFKVAPLGAATLILRNLTVRNGLSDVGGGILVQSSGALILENVVIENCSAPNFGGAIGTFGGPVTIKNSVISGNSCTAGNGSGGAVWVHQSAIATLERTVIANNSALNWGTAFHVRGELNLTDCTVEDNTGSPYAIAFNDPFGPTFTAKRTTFRGNPGVLTTNGGITNVTLENCTITGNSFPTQGILGAGNAGGTITMTNCTVTNNAGGIRRLAGTFNLRNTLVAGNSSFDGSGTFTSLGYNLIGNASGMGFTGDTTGNLLNVDPMLDLLADNGGPTMTHSLLPGSPAINAAHPTIFPSEDQRGVGRPLDGAGDRSIRADIGAYERIPESAGDINGDGVVDVPDLFFLLANWGPCKDCNNCPADLNGDCTVDLLDLFILLINWG